jgi:hypothetical protein
MPVSGPSLNIDIAAMAVENWTINITVKLKDGTVITTPPANTVDVTLTDLNESFPNAIVQVIGTVRVNSSGVATFTNIQGAYSSLYIWYANLYQIKAKHIPSGKEATVWLWLDSQMGNGYASFDFPPTPRTWSLQ